MFNGISKEEFIKAVSLSLHYDDLIGRLGTNMCVFSSFYSYFRANRNELPYDIRGKLEALNNGKVIESNYRYMNSLYFKELKDVAHRMGTSTCYDVELLDEIYKTSAYKTYQISDAEIIQLAKKVGFNITTVEELEDKVRIDFLNSLNIKAPIEKSRLLYKTKGQPLFDIDTGHLLYIAKLAGIEVI